jgi:hypothetical protein
MAQWGKTDTKEDSVLWGVSQLNQTANTSNRDLLFGNTTSDGYITNVTIGQYGVDAAEATASLGAIPHAGWVLRTEGTGGRLGRVQHEVLVAMGSMTGDATPSDDDVIPDFGIVITSQPTDQSITNPDTASFSVTAVTSPTGGTLGYQWQRATAGAPETWVNITAITTPSDSGLSYAVSGGSDFTDSPTLQVTSSSTASTGYRYRVVITATGGTTAGVTSDVATITIS